MRLVAFEQSGSSRLGVVENDSVIDLATAAPDLSRDLTGLILRGNSGWTSVADAAQRAPASARRPLGSLKLLPPIQNPAKIVCLGLNYVDHAARAGPANPAYPTSLLPLAPP